jgi:8-oxo-dGTP pyrophosphatase MutT (NUDIX family)
MTLKPWKLLSRTTLLETRIFRVLGDRYISPRTGDDLTYSVVDSADWVNVIALDERDQIVLIRQFRVGTAEMTLEVPGGMVDRGESPADAALRELREETGYRPKTVIDLGFVYPNPAIFNNRAYVFLCEGCVPAYELALDDGEDIEVLPTKLSEVLEMLHDGRISHALVAVALHRFQLYREGLLRLGSGA